MTTLTESIKPFSFRREEIAVGAIVDGKFVQDRKLWNVTKDSRLKVTRKYEGSYGKASNVHHYTVDIPAGYEQAIACKWLDGQGTTLIEEKFAVLYAPEIKVADPVKKPRAKKQVSPVVAAMQLPEGKKARLVRGKLVIK